MKKIITFLTLVLCTIVTNAQLINPSQSTEVCAGVNITFHATFSGTTIQSFTSWTNGATVITPPIILPQLVGLPTSTL